MRILFSIITNQSFKSPSQRSGRISKRLAEKAMEKGGVEGMTEDDGGQKEETTSTPACDPSLKEVQTTSLPPSQFYTACTYSLLIHIKVIQQFTHHA